MAMTITFIFIQGMLLVGVTRDN